MFEDKVLVCKDCGKQFVFSAGEQDFYAQQNFQNEPLRCPECRRLRKKPRTPEREMFDAVCAGCGAPTKVPFQPRNDKPIYCEDCYRKRRQNGPSRRSY
ncbi:MAG TPA: zinc-ribbon domain containing protein [Eubacteriales bacterium]|nr:zinc-ribbon domain containing protein [Clostridia bacterium]HRV72412.1 zinc-ribbon domain containing protein [Eubacteriales bacterium]